MKSPSVVKAVFGGISAFLLLLFAVISFINLDVIGVVLSGGYQMNVNIPLISAGNFIAWAIYLIFAIVSLLLAAFDIIFTVKEIRLLCAKNATKSLLENIMSSITRLEQSMQFDLQQGTDVLSSAVMQGKDVHITKNASAYMVEDIDGRIRKGAEFTNKTNRQRKGINLALIIISFVIVLLGVFTYIQPLADAVNSIFVSVDIDRPDILIPTEETTDEPVEEYKISTYSVIKSDSTWLQANRSALNSGGYLVSINDREEFDKVCEMAEDEGIYVFWLGASRTEYEDWEDIIWEDGTELSYRPWLSGEPTYYSEDGDREDYLMAFKVGDDWFFNDSENDAIAASPNYEGKIGFIIEYEE